MNRDEAKNVLLLYRFEADAADPQIAAAISFMKSDSELREWFEDHCARQKILREKFRQIPSPEGLVQQIISEQKVMAEKKSRRDKFVAVGAVVAIVAALAVMVMVYLPHRPPQVAYNTLANYQVQMLNTASLGYAMDLATNDLDQIRAYLAKKQCPADYTLPMALEKATATGCTREDFQNAKVSMICFSTGKPLPANHPGDLWLFVTPDSAVKDPPTSATPRLVVVNGVSVATWAQGGNIYVLATPGDEQAVQKYL
jgi:hypothetical protein